MVRKNKKKIKKLLGDGLHDCKATFNLCDELNIEPVIKIRKNASTKARDSFLRKKNVIEKVIGLFGGKEGYQISIENDQTGKIQTVTDYISFDVSRLEKGTYELKLIVKDNVSGEETSTIAEFMLN